MTCGKPAVPSSENPKPQFSLRLKTTISSSAMVKWPTRIGFFAYEFLFFFSLFFFFLFRRVSALFYFFSFVFTYVLYVLILRALHAQNAHTSTTHTKHSIRLIFTIRWSLRPSRSTERLLESWFVGEHLDTWLVFESFPILLMHRQTNAWHFSLRTKFVPGLPCVKLQPT